MIHGIVLALAAAGEAGQEQLLQAIPSANGTPWAPIMGFAGACILLGAGGANFFRAKGIKEVTGSIEMQNAIDARIDHKARNAEQVASMKFELFSQTLRRMEKSLDRMEKTVNNLRIKAAVNDTIHDSVHNDNDETDVDA